MPWVIGALGLALLLTVLWDAFETIVLPRRVRRRCRAWTRRPERDRTR